MRIDLDQDINKVASDIQKAFASSDAGVRLDSNQSLFLAKELTKKSTSVLEKEYTDLKHKEYLPVINENTPADNLELPIFNKTGSYSISKKIADNTPAVDEYIDSQIVPVYTVQSHASWDVLELAQASMIGRSINTDKLISTRDQWEYANEDAAWKGISKDGSRLVKGLFHYMTAAAGDFKMSEYTLSVDGTGSGDARKLFANKTAAQIIADLLGFVRAAYEAKQISMYKSTDLLLPLTIKTQLEKQAWSSGSDRNILEYVSAITGVRIGELAELNSVADISDSAMICYNKNPKYLGHFVTMPYQMSNPTVNGFKTRVETMGRLVGGVVREPQAVYFAKHLL